MAAKKKARRSTVQRKDDASRRNAGISSTAERSAPSPIEKSPRRKEPSRSGAKGNAAQANVPKRSARGNGAQATAPKRSARGNGAQPATPKRILVLDVGGSHVKLRIGDRGNRRKFVSGPKMTPAAMVKRVGKLVAPTDYDAVSIGYPGVVVRGRIAAEPFNLGAGWMGFDFEKTLGKPVRIINDAAMQAVGSYTGGRMLFLGLGTGMGATLVLDGVVEPMEFGHLPYKHGRTYEQYVGQRGMDRLGKKRWRKEVAGVVERLRYALEVEYVVLGGGNARLLKELPKKVRLGANSNAMKGGRLIWEGNGGSSLALSPKYRERAATRGK